MPDTLTVNDAGYTVIRLLGKGKGGYSYLVTDGAAQYVLKQIHHEPCEYYTFGDKLQAELRDYETLRKMEKKGYVVSGKPGEKGICFWMTREGLDWLGEKIRIQIHDPRD